MCNCNSKWANNAKYLVSSNSISFVEKTVLEYLLKNNHCGINNGVSINNVLEYINNALTLKYSREYFQHQIMIPLKQKGVITTLMYPGKKGSLFIPCNDKEINIVYKQILERIFSELNNVHTIVISTSINQNINSLILQIQNEITKL
jgi:hypothetical protein